MPRWLKIIVPLVLVAGLVAVSPLGKLIYLNVRADDPLLQQWQDYDAGRFAQAIESKADLLVQIYASWCPVCEAQHRSFQALEAKGQVPDAQLFRVDFDRDTDFLKQYKVTSTGQLLVFRNGTLLTRGQGLVDENKILSFLEEASIPVH
ncbi:hypothetical protein GCM10007972_13410 [Iodidimonas muriae]|uniref:Thioredoxin domain-containing protein n=1 Tax=Iodidimonas muriae TaxID=261467 RepID=A0ABQ2LCP9_9PROT|nr:thioredoxin family protein [Iodidimonas muriae]GER07433.1 hypothetical protein JCM17843_17430 [Kordiimonadales bacterium JCM 17843]GGO10535.1 hypothetical protein GCM10007972_13410 [Iodidimonas muriae]